MKQTFAILCVLGFLFSSISFDAVLAQDDDPFGASNSDPFGNLDKSGTTQLSGEDDVKRLKNELKTTERRREAEQSKYRAELIQLRKRIEKLVVENRKHSIHSGFGEKFHSSILYELLIGNEEQQTIALKHLVDLLEKKSLTGATYSPISSLVFDRVQELTSSMDKDVHAMSVQILQIAHPQRAVDSGYQAGRTWRAVSSGSVAENKIRNVLEIVCDLEYDEIPIVELIDEIQDNYRINVFLDPEINSHISVTFSGARGRLRSLLSQLLDRYGLTFCIENDGLNIVKNSSPKRITTLTYNVRGLITEDRSIDKLAEISKSQLADTGEIKVVGKYQLVARADENEQSKISKVLGSLNTKP